MKNKTQQHNAVRLVGIGDTSHARHHAEHVVVDGVHTDLGRGRAGDRSRRKNELENCVINARKVA